MSLTRSAASVVLCAGLLLVAGCSSSSPTSDAAPVADEDTRVVATEQGDVEIPADPQRIVVLNPDLTGYFYAVDTSVQAAVPLNTDAQEFPASYHEEGVADGSHVRALQTVMNKRSAGVEVDGNFGPVMHTAVSNFQSANRLVSDGQAGPITWQALVG